MRARVPILVACTILSAPLQAQEACEQDDEGLANQLDENIVLENARTAEDFANALAYYFFTNAKGYVNFVVLTNDLGFGDWVRYFVALASTFEYSFVACNEIGQCAQGQLVSVYSKMPSDTATRATNSVLDFLTGGELSVGEVYSTGLVRHRFTVSMADGSSQSIDIREGDPRALTSGATTLPVRKDGDLLTADKRCRNNEGELTDKEPELPTGGGGGTDPTLLAMNTGYFLKVQTGWRCRADATGVVCKRVYAYVWIDRWG